MLPMRFFLALILTCAAFSSLAAELALGEQAPEVQALLLGSNQSFVLSAQKGKVTIINFWATWCGPCKAEMPMLAAWYEKHKDEGLTILAISMDDKRLLPEVQKVAALYPFQFAMKGDASFKGLGRIWRLPSTFVIDREGLLRKNGHQGDAEITQTELDALVTPLLIKN